MTASVIDILIEQGTTWKRVLTLKDGNGTPINLNGYSFRGSIRKSASSSDVIASFTFTIAQPSSDGTVEMLMSETETAQIPATGASYANLTVMTYDVEMVGSLGQVTRIMNGKASVSPEVTR